MGHVPSVTKCDIPERSACLEQELQRLYTLCLAFDKLANMSQQSWRMVPKIAQALPDVLRKTIVNLAENDFESMVLYARERADHLANDLEGRARILMADMESVEPIERELTELDLFDVTTTATLDYQDIHELQCRVRGRRERLIFGRKTYRPNRSAKGKEYTIRKMRISYRDSIPADWREPIPAAQ